MFGSCPRNRLLFIELGQGSTSRDRSSAWAGQRCPRRLRFCAWGWRLGGDIPGRSALDRFQWVKVQPSLVLLSDCEILAKADLQWFSPIVRDFHAAQEAAK